MARRVDNAFTRSWIGTGAGIAGRPTFQPLRAQLRAERPGADEDPITAPQRRWSLEMTPMRLLDALPAWCGSGLDEGAQTILLEATFAGVSGRLTPGSLAELCHEVLGRPAEAGGGTGLAIIAPDCVVLDDEALVKLAVDGRLVGATLVRIHGPIEPRDAEAVRRARARGLPAWAGDFRAVSAMRILDDRAIELVSACESLMLNIVAENLRHFLAAVLDEEVDGIAAPSAAQVHRLLSVSGSMLVRPIETDPYATFVDVGICTSPDEDVPAGQSLIYDLPSASWHDEP